MVPRNKFEHYRIETKFEQPYFLILFLIENKVFTWSPGISSSPIGSKLNFSSRFLILFSTDNKVFTWSPGIRSSPIGSKLNCSSRFLILFSIQKQGRDCIPARQPQFLIYVLFGVLSWPEKHKLDATFCLVVDLPSRLFLFSALSLFTRTTVGERKALSPIAMIREINKKR